MPTGARWEGEFAHCASEKFGAVVVDEAGVDDWEGWGALGLFAMIGWSYGSCSARASFEGAKGW